MRHSEIERLLPRVFQRAKPPGSPLAALLDVMEALHEPAEAILAELVGCFDPRRADERFLTMLAHWVNLDRLYPASESNEPGPDWRTRAAPLPPGRLRELIATAPRLAQLRGTARGLEIFLEIAIGMPFTLDEAVTTESGAVVPFHVRITAPAQAQPQHELIARIIELEKPAYVTFDLVFAGP
jgi:phage tail-like protein